MTSRRFPAPWQVEQIPGGYKVLDANGQLAGTRMHLGPFDVARATAPPERLPAMQRSLDAPLGDALTLLGSDRDRSDLRPGETLALSLYWQAEGEIAEVQTVTLWLEKEEDVITLWQGNPVQGRYPFARWQAPEFVRDRYALRLPLEASAGDYELRLALLDKQGKSDTISVVEKKRRETYAMRTQPKAITLLLAQLLEQRSYSCVGEVGATGV